MARARLERAAAAGAVAEGAVVEDAVLVVRVVVAVVVEMVATASRLVVIRLGLPKLIPAACASCGSRMCQ